MRINNGTVSRRTPAVFSPSQRTDPLWSNCTQTQQTVDWPEHIITVLDRNRFPLLLLKSYLLQ